MNTLVFGLPGSEDLVQDVAAAMSIPQGSYEFRHFPDGESYFRIKNDVDGKDILLVARLDHPNGKILDTYFLARGLKEYGARHITLVAPYLPYMRQDKAFKRGELITSRLFARLLDEAIDNLITIDPHLHRYTSLSDLYEARAIVSSASHLIAEWISNSVTKPLIIGPDQESEQWVRRVAEHIGAPYRVCTKRRNGDDDVEIDVPDLAEFAAYSAVIVDDVVSSGGTLREIAYQLSRRGFHDIIAVCTHALLSEEQKVALFSNGLKRLVATNSVTNHASEIPIQPILIDAIAEAIAHKSD